MGDEEDKSIGAKLNTIGARDSTPEKTSFLALAERTCDALDREPGSIRPLTTKGKPGGLVRLRTGIPTIIVPDLHARMDFVLNLIRYPVGGDDVLGALAAGSVQIVCVGDGFHAEGRAADRWRSAFAEFRKSYKKHTHMDEEMRESMGLMEMIMELKLAFPDVFHFLKGNHENVKNEEGDGNLPFGKFAYEGEMVTEYIRRFYGEDLLDQYSGFEKRLPLLAVGSGFLVSHAEPAEVYPMARVIERDPDVIFGLTWTRDGEAEEGSVKGMLDAYLGVSGDRRFYFGGHRTIGESYRLRADGQYVQLHNPNLQTVAWMPSDGDFDPDRDIRVLPL